MTDATTPASSELQLGACFGRYRGWKSVGAPASASTQETTTAAASDAEELPSAQAQNENGDSEMNDGDAADATTTAAPATTTEQAAPLPGAIVVQFEATAREDFRVGFAPPRAGREPSQWAYEVAVGFSGNTEVVWRKYNAKARGSSSAEREVDLAKVFAGRTCSLQDFVAYWIVVQQGVLVFGIGSQVGADTIAKYVDEDAVGVQQVALTTWDTPATFRNIVFTPVFDSPLDVNSMVPGTIVRADPSGQVDLVTPEERAEYDRAVVAAKRRAERFGGTYVPPAIKSFVDPKTIRKLQRTGAVEPGFTTGFDVTSTEELSKREQRMKRFNTPEFALAYSTETVRALTDGMTQDEWQAKEAEKAKLEERARKFGVATEKRELNLVPANAKVQSERCDIKAAGDSSAEVRTDAIHMYALDDRFQQVRTSDVLAFFTGYGPSYVEWINDSSCTVVFQDPFTAGRALISLAQEIPPQSKAAEAAPAATSDDVEMDGETASTTMTDSVAADAATAESNSAADVLDDSFNRSHWRFGLPISSSTQPSHKTWRVLLRKATDDDFPAEKTNKKYHERSQSGRDRHRHMAQRSRGHRQAPYDAPSQRSGSGGGLRGDGSSMPSRYSSKPSSSSSSGRAHPYGSSSGRRRRDRNDSRDFDDHDDRDNDDSRRSRRRPRDTGKPSDRIRVNDDGSINFVRKSDGASSSSAMAADSVAPATTD